MTFYSLFNEFDWNCATHQVNKGSRKSEGSETNPLFCSTMVFATDAGGLLALETCRFSAPKTGKPFYSGGRGRGAIGKKKMNKQKDRNWHGRPGTGAEQEPNARGEGSEASGVNSEKCPF